MTRDYPGGLEGKESTCSTADPGLIPRSGRFPWRRKWQPTPVFLPGKSHGQRSQMDYSPWGRKESDMTEHAHAHTHTHTHRPTYLMKYLSQ